MSAYGRSEVVKQRDYGGLLSWAADISGGPLPPDATDDAIRLVLLAERVAQTPDALVDRIIPYMLQDPIIYQNLTLHMAGFLNSTDTETVESQIDEAIDAAAPRLAAVLISDGEVNAWRSTHLKH